MLPREHSQARATQPGCPGQPLVLLDDSLRISPEMTEIGYSSATSNPSHAGIRMWHELTTSRRGTDREVNRWTCRVRRLRACRPVLLRPHQNSDSISFTDQPTLHPRQVSGLVALTTRSQGGPRDCPSPVVPDEGGQGCGTNPTNTIGVHNPPGSQFPILDRDIPRHSIPASSHGNCRSTDQRSSV